MHDTQLYQRILGLTEPWFVSRVELNTAQSRVDIWVEHRPKTRFCCPVCDKEVVLYDHTEERVWRHLDTCQLKTFLHARVPRAGCPEHGIHKVKVPWAQTRSRFTLLMERLIIDVIRQCQTITGACELMRISWDEAFGVMRRAVMRGQERKETLRDLWSYRSITWAGKFFDKWFGWAKRSKLTPVKKVADMIHSRIDNVLSYCRHAITNGVAEGLNSKIMTIKRKCCGFRNVENFKTAIYFHCGGLDLYPL